jgi:hypothetical protein
LQESLGVIGARIRNHRALSVVIARLAGKSDLVRLATSKDPELGVSRVPLATQWPRALEIAHCDISTGHRDDWVARLKRAMTTLLGVGIST